MTTRRVGTRVAVAQLACHPAAVLGLRAPLEDPLFSLKDAADTLPTPGDVAPALGERVGALRDRIRAAYCAQLMLKIRAVLDACKGWDVQVLVLPEYSVPWQVLDEVAALTGDLVLVAGTHTVTRESHKSGVYQRLGGVLPEVRQAVAPVLHRGKLLGLQAKLNPAGPEATSQAPGRAWDAIALPPPLPSPLGVLICLDFLVEAASDPEVSTRDKVGASRLLVVPSWTGSHTLAEFESKAWAHAARYRTPVLLANAAAEGGSTIFIEERRGGAPSRYPEQVGALGRDEEGIVIADLDLRDQRPGRLTPYEWRPTVRPVALASLVYRVDPAGHAYAQWLAAQAPRLERGDDGALDELLQAVRDDRSVIERAGSVPGAASRQRRLRRLIGNCDRIQDCEEVALLTREVALPTEAVPFPIVRAAMAHGAALAVEDWMALDELRGQQLELAILRARLDEGGREAAKPVPAEWTEDGLRALGAVVQAVRGERPGAAIPLSPETVRVEVPVLPRGIDPLAIPDFEHEGRRVVFRTRACDVLESLRNDTDDIEDGVLTGVTQTDLKVDLVASLLRAEGVHRVAVVGIGGRSSTRGVLASSDGRWVVSVMRDSADSLPGVVAGERIPLSAHEPRLADALAAVGLSEVQGLIVSDAELQDRIAALRPRFAGAEEMVKRLRAASLREMGGHYIDLDLRHGVEVAPARTLLDRWLGQEYRVALVLGTFGAGKSTLLADWCLHRWRSDRGGPMPVLVDLAGVGDGADPEAMLLEAAALKDSAANRAALALLIAAAHVVPCFDGLDEMATRIQPSALASRLAALTKVVTNGGHAIVSSRSNYFPTEGTLQEAERALAEPLAGGVAHVRLEVQELDADKIRRLVSDVVGPHRAPETLRRIETTYDLRDLARRPLLLALILKTIDQLGDGRRVTLAALYEQVLEWWLVHADDGMRDIFTHDQKRAFAEVLAERLWTTGRPSISWDDLRLSVREQLGRELPGDLPPDAAILEMAKGAFFVREGDDQFRFAHKSFLVYFLARALVRTLAQGSLRGLRARPLTQEIVAVVNEVLQGAGGEPAPRHPAVAAVQSWLGGGRQVEGDPSASVVVAANALRLLHGLARTNKTDGWLPAGADLRGISLRGADLAGAQLDAANLDDADLSACSLVGAKFHNASLRRACLDGVVLDDAVLKGAILRGASLRRARARRADLSAVDLDAADLTQSNWSECRWQGSKWSRARVTAAVFHRTDGAAPQVPTVKPVLGLATGHAGRVWSVTWSADGRRVASGGEDGSIRLWEIWGRGEAQRLMGHTGIVWSVAWSPDGRHVSSGGEDGSVRVWDVDSGQEKLRLDGHAGSVWSVAWSDDGRRLASGGDDGSVRVWDVEGCAEERKFTGHVGRALGVAWSGDGRHVASGGADGSVRVWDMVAGHEVQRLTGHTGSVWSVTWSGDGRVTSGGDDRSVRMWNVAIGAEEQQLTGHAGPVLGVAWSGKLRRVASAGGDGSVRVWDAALGEDHLRLTGHDGSVWSVAWSRDGRHVASGGHDGSVRVWDVAGGREEEWLSGHVASVLSVAWSRDGRSVASGGEDGSVRLWDVSSGGEERRLARQASSLLSVAWSRDGRRVASGGEDGSVRVWSTADGEAEQRLTGHEGRVWSVAWSGDGRRLASSGADGSVRVWDVERGEEERQLVGHIGWVLSVAWSEDGRRVASGGADESVRIWDVVRGEQEERRTGHAGIVWSVAWSRDGRRVASGGADGTVRVWEVGSGAEEQRLTGHVGRVTGVAWSPDSRRVVTGGEDGSVRVWDVTHGKENQRLMGHAGRVFSVAWSEDGGRMASGGEDGSVHVWEVAIAHDNAVVRPLLAMYAKGNSTLALIPVGYGVARVTADVPLVLAVSNPRSPGSTLYVPLGALRDVFLRPDLVRAFLAGEPLESTPFEELRAQGWSSDPPWDGADAVLGESEASVRHRAADSGGLHPE